MSMPDKKIQWEKVAHVKQCVLDKFVVVEGFKRYLPGLLNSSYQIPHFKFADSEIFYDFSNRRNLQKNIALDTVKNCNWILDVHEQIGGELLKFSKKLKSRDFVNYTNDKLAQLLGDFLYYKDWV